MFLKAVILSIFLEAGLYESKLSFPSNFKFGAGSAAVQVEGAWNLDGKSENIIDHHFHMSNYTENPDVAADSYHNWRKDVEMIKELGLDFYRFSISWSRLLPTGVPDYINGKGRVYYSNLIDALLSNGIEPVVTLLHFDLPQSLQDRGGWQSPDFINWFTDYARIAFTLYGDRVKTWFTINEPSLTCYLLNPTLFPEDVINPYSCIKNLVLAHATAYRVYDKEFRALQKGKLSIVEQLLWFEGETEDDAGLAELTRQLFGGIAAHPIFSKTGGWPPLLEKYLAISSERNKTFALPALTDDEIDLVKGTYDFYGLNYYTGRTVRKATATDVIGPWPFFGAPQINAVYGKRPEWDDTTVDWLITCPICLRRMLRWIKHQYGDIDIIIAENGVASIEQNIRDDNRTEYLQAHLEQVANVIKEDNINIIGYTAWSLMDSFEYFYGYRTFFGLYQVNFTDPKRTRTPRQSAQYYKSVIEESRKEEKSQNQKLISSQVPQPSLLTNLLTKEQSNILNFFFFFFK